MPIGLLKAMLPGQRLSCKHESGGAQLTIRTKPLKLHHLDIQTGYAALESWYSRSVYMIVDNTHEASSASSFRTY